MNTYTPTIGIEVHAELKTNTKMFCDCRNDPHAGEANAYTCPICMAHPGTLPVINYEAVKHVLKVGLALGSEIATYTEFDRKNYFYPDIPKGYQISQYLYPLVKKGTLDGVAITRVHLEEDTARSQHESGEGSLVDYSRAGVPLMELVTEPVIHDAKTAGHFARELQLLLRTLGVSDANMERGEMRVEANISVSKTDTFGTKVEVKNLNSFRSVESAIEYEIKRQIGLLENGEHVVQETRGWDETKQKTFSQRLKESADDYRYFPDPDLPKLDLSAIPEFSLSRLTHEMPTLPNNKREKYTDIGITREAIEVIISDAELDCFFATLLAKGDVPDDIAKLSANYLTTDVTALRLAGHQLDLSVVDKFLGLMKLVAASSINSRIAKDLLPEILGGADAEVLVAERGLAQSSSIDTLVPLVKEIIAAHPEVVAEYRGGKVSSIQFLVGQGMKLSKGSANPAVLKQLLEANISSTDSSIQ